MARKPATRAAKSASAAARKTVAARPVLQWIGAGLGMLVTLGAIGVILVEAMAPARPVAFSVAVREVRPTEGGWIAEVEVGNRGSTAAAGVTLEGMAGEQTAAATLDYVPGDGEATAFLRFPRDPRTAPPVVVVTGWSEP